MTMILWGIVAILALLGLVWLFARDWKRGGNIARPEQAPPTWTLRLDTDGRVAGTAQRAPDSEATFDFTALTTEDAKPDRRPKFEVYRDKRNSYRWRLLSANGRTLCSGESHTRARDAVRAISTVIQTAGKADVVHANRSR